MIKDTQRKQAAHFLALHHQERMLILPNAWDAISARIYELEGFSAIGTTSAGISATLGYPDGQQMSLEDNLRVARRIRKVVNLPISVDIEAGYAESPDGVATTALATIEAGAVGVNIEDSTGDPVCPLYDIALQHDRIGAIRDAARSQDIRLVVNARTDVFLVENSSPEGRIGEAIARANRYVEAGADCIFVPDRGELDRTAIETLVREIDAPLNVIAGSSTPSVSALEEIGVSRLSLGPRPMRAALAQVQRAARELLDSGTYVQLESGEVTYEFVNKMFAEPNK